MREEIVESFLRLFAERDVAGATALLQTHPEVASHTGYEAHPLLREFVMRNCGHCHKARHMLIADLLIPEAIRSFRDAVLADQLDVVRNHLCADADLVSAEFTSGHGIAQAIHHWKSTEVGAVLLDAGADIDVLTTRGESPLSMQLRFGRIEGVRFLLERGANPNNGRSGIMPSDTMTDLVELLLEHGWDINNNEMLHDANHAHGSRVRIWLSYGADPNAKREDGQTALHLFAMRGTGREAIRALVKAGADINARNDEGNTPLDLAKLAKRLTASRELIALGAAGCDRD